MVASPVQRLLGAVRRRLWWAQLVAAVRLALWGSAGLMLLAAAAHLAAQPFRPGAIHIALALPWASALAWAGLTRPSDSACALWADRQLGGTSAFATLLEMRERTQTGPNTPAVQWLEQWATARVPHGLQLLAERHDSARLARPLLSMLVCAALATLVLTRPNTVPTSRQEFAASSPPRVADRPAPGAEPPVPAERVSELASALRSAESLSMSDRREAGRSAAAGQGKSDDGTGSQTAQSGVPPPDRRATASESPVGALADAAPGTGAAQAPGAGSGRDAGDSPDDRADAGVSRVLRGTLPVQMRELRAGRPSSDRQADMDQAATYDEQPAPHGAAMTRVEPVPIAATPPVATEAVRLTPTEATYVQAWMKASGRRP
jgi:hypothetical protein